MVNSAIAQETRAWYEFTPFDFGNAKLGFIDVKGFGSTFRDLHTDGPEEYSEDLLYLEMGLWGSAFAVDQEYLPKILKKGWEFFFGNRPLLGKSTLTSVPDPFDPNGENRINLIDAGIAFNLPFPALLHRDVDVIIACDMSAGIEGPSEVLKFVKAFPDWITEEEIGPAKWGKDEPKLRVWTFRDPEDAKREIKIIYLPHLGDAKAIPSTFHFSYTPEMVQKYVKLIDDNLNSVADTLIRELIRVAKAKK